MSPLRRLGQRLLPLAVRRPAGIALDKARRGASRRASSYVVDVLGRAPFLRLRDRVYDDSFYEGVDAESSELYHRVADALVELCAPKSVVDVGCGTGIMLARFAGHGVVIRGIEGSTAAIRRSPVSDRIVHANLEREVPFLGRSDLCLCIEVAEHLRRGAAPRLVHGLTQMSDVVVFTAAQPGQPGTAHLNLQPKRYWAELFAERGYAQASLERLLLAAIAEVPRPEYIHANLMVFEKAR